MVDAPIPTPVAPPEELTLATPGNEELQAACPVTSWLLLSENVAVAANCWNPPRRMLGLEGAIPSETATGAFTVRAVDAEIEPSVAVMVAVPAPALVASPLEPAELLTIATPALELLQVTTLVMFCTVASV